MTKKDNIRIIFQRLVLCLSFSLVFSPFDYACHDVHAAEKAVLKQSDFKYVGAFLMPTSAGGGDAGWSRGLAHRYVNGELRMFSVAWNPQNLYEVRVPTPSINSPFPQAQIVRGWGDVTMPARRNTTNGGTESGVINGLYWDQQDQRLYWSYGALYTTSSDDPAVGYSMLNDATASSTVVGVWRFTGRGQKAVNMSVVPIPQWFADAYTGGKRLAAGCGGYQSIVASGPAHLGPALTAFNPPNINTNPSGSTLSFLNLVGYPYQNNPIDCSKRAIRDTNYVDGFDGCNPDNGVGHWSWSDYLWQGGAWVDLADKHGVVFFPTLANGREWYETSTLHAEKASHWVYIYDPYDLAEVARGVKKQWEIQAVNRWAIQFPGLTYPLSGWSDEPAKMVTGVTYDSVARRAYVAVRFAGETGGHKVYVYEIGSPSSVFAKPIAPTNLKVLQ